MSRVQNLTDSVVDVVFSIENYTALLRYISAVLLQYEMSHNPDLKSYQLLRHISDQYQSIVEETINDYNLQDYDDLYEFISMFQDYLDEIENLSEDRGRAYVRWILSLFTVNKSKSHDFYDMLDQFLEFDISFEMNDIFEDLLVCAYNFSH